MVSSRNGLVFSSTRLSVLLVNCLKVVQQKKYDVFKITIRWPIANDIKSLCHHDDILQKQIPTNDYSLEGGYLS